MALTLSKEERNLNYKTVESIIENENFILKEKYELPVVIQKENEIIISDVFPIEFRYDTEWYNYELYIDSLTLKEQYQKQYNVYLAHNTNYQRFKYDETLEKLTIINEENNVTYTIFLKRV